MRLLSLVSKVVTVLTFTISFSPGGRSTRELLNAAHSATWADARIPRSYVIKTGFSSTNDLNGGTIPSQVPNITGLPGLIDGHTPTSVYSRCVCFSAPIVSLRSD